MKRVRALLAIHENYRWRGVWTVLKSPVPEYVRLNFDPERRYCKTWQLLLRCPDAVIGWQMGLAEGTAV